jgi:hypothetical protein
MNLYVPHSFRLLTQCWDSQSRELKLWSATRERPASGYALEVHSRLKPEFATRDGVTAVEEAVEAFPVLQIRTFTRRPKRVGPDSLNLIYVVFSFGRVRQGPHRALVNRAAGRLGRPASIPCAIMSHSPEAFAFGSRRHFIPASLSLPLCGCLLNRSRDCSRSRVPPRFQRRRYADAPAAASICCLRFAPSLFGASARRGGTLSLWAAFFVRK